jgi:hypothetical protein
MYFLALHKDPKHPEKLHPIGIGTAWCRIIGSIIVAHINQDAAALLLPFGQFSIGISGGIDTIAHLTRILVDRHIKSPLLQTRVLISLDIINMFNSCSRETCQSAISQHFPSLLPFFDAICNSDNKCWYINHLSKWDCFLQTEGFAQGCPLSPLFASLVLTEVLRPLQQELALRATTRFRQGFQGDDLQGSCAATSAYFDDSNSAVAFEDSYFYLTHFMALGKPHGILVSLDKSLILTSTMGSSPLPFLPDHQASPLCQALALLSPNAECTTGLHLVGQPIGNDDFCASFLLQKSQDF